MGASLDGRIGFVVFCGFETIKASEWAFERGGGTAALFLVVSRNGEGCGEIILFGGVPVNLVDGDSSGVFGDCLIFDIFSTL